MDSDTSKAFASGEGVFAFVAAVLVSALLAVLSIAHGLHYETNDDPAISMVLRGLAADQAFDGLGALYRLAGPVLAGVYRMHPDGAWNGLFLFGSTLFAHCFWSFWLWAFLPRQMPRWGKAIALLCFALAAWYGSFVFLNLNRSALYLGMTGLLAGHVALVQDKRWRNRVSTLSLAVFCLTVSIGIRPMGMPMLVVLYAAMLCLTLLRQVWIKKAGQNMWLWPAPARRMTGWVLLVAAAVALEHAVVERPYADDPAVYRGMQAIKALDYGMERPWWVQNHADALSAKALRRFSYADPQIFGQDRVERMAYARPWAPARWRSDQSPGFWEAFSAVHRYWWAHLRHRYALPLWLFLGAVLALAAVPSARRWALPFIGYGLLAYGVVLLLATMLKMHDRVLEPLLMPLVFGSILALGHGLYKTLEGWSGWSMYPVLWVLWSVGLIPASSRSYDAFLASKQGAQRHRSDMVGQQVTLLPVLYGQSVLWTIPAYQLLVDANPLRPSPWRAMDEVVLMDGWLACLPDQVQWRAQRTGQVRFVDQWSALLDGGGIVLTDRNHAAFLAEYFNEGYGRELVWSDTLWRSGTDAGLMVLAGRLE